VPKPNMVSTQGIKLLLHLVGHHLLLWLSCCCSC
jgi:hypothetical protein